MKNASSVIPEDRKKRTYISLAATAGMRLLQYRKRNIHEYLKFNFSKLAIYRLRNATLADTILNYIRDYFSKTSFLYNDQNQVRILSGQEEVSRFFHSYIYKFEVFNSLSK